MMDLLKNNTPSKDDEKEESQLSIKDDPFIQEAKDDPFLPPDYTPSYDENYMSPLMLAYFKRKLLAWRDKLIQDSTERIHIIQAQVPSEPDNVDNAVLERDRDDELQKLKRNEDLMYEIDDAIERIHNGTYGFCQETGEPIGLKRLEAWPIALLITEAQDKKEKAKG